MALLLFFSQNSITFFKFLENQPLSPAYPKAKSYRASTTNSKDRNLFPSSSRKPIITNHLTPQNKTNQRFDKAKIFIASENSKKKVNRKNIEIGSVNRVSFNPNEDAFNLIKKTCNSQKNGHVIISEKSLEFGLNSLSKFHIVKDQKNMKISPFDETLKEISQENFERSTKKHLANFSDAKKSFKTNDNFIGKTPIKVFKSGEMDFKSKKKDFFVNNIINMMNNKTLCKPAQKSDELTKKMQGTGKENDVLLDAGKEKRQTKIYQYILDH